MTPAIPVLDQTPPDKLDELWRRFNASRDTMDRDALILQYKQLVQFVTRRIAVTYPDGDQTDFFANGVLGLVDAVEKFKPERGFKFETYAMNRIKASILEGPIAEGSLGMGP